MIQPWSKNGGNPCQKTNMRLLPLPAMFAFMAGISHILKHVYTIEEKFE